MFQMSEILKIFHLEHFQ